MIRRSIRRAALAAALALPMLAAAAPAAGPQFAGLSTIESGLWALRDADAGAGRTVCFNDPAKLLQLAHHSGGHCPQAVLTDGDNTTQVHYTCPGNGHGQTTITVETPRLIRIQTQGIAHGLPFDFDYEGRRIGECRPRWR